MRNGLEKNVWVNTVSVQCLSNAGPLLTTFSRTAEVLPNILLVKLSFIINQERLPRLLRSWTENDILPSVAWLRDVSTNKRTSHDCHMITQNAPEVCREQNSLRICAVYPRERNN